jgi:hypothetical protein
MEITGWFREYELEDVKLAIQAAMQMAERFGEDFGIGQDLSVKPLWSFSEPPLEIIRCPEALKKKSAKTKIYRVIK